MNFEKTINMKRLLIVLLFIFFSKGLHAQIVTDTVHYLFKGELDGDAIRAYLGEGNPFFNPSSKPKYSPFITPFIPTSLRITKQMLQESVKEVKELFDDSSEFRKNRPNYVVAASFDSAAVVFTVNRINHENAGDFEFKILENKKKELLPWSLIKLFCETYAQIFDSNGKEEREMAYLGEFKTSFGNNLTVDVRRKGATKMTLSLTIAWVNWQPEVLGVFTNKEFPDFFHVFKRESQSMVTLPLITPEERNLEDSQFILKKSFAADENSLLFLLNNKVRFKEMIEYKLQGPGGVQDWQKNSLDENLIWLRDLPPGKYKLFIRYNFQRHNVTEYEFEIKPAWHQTTMFKISAGSLTAAFFGFIFLLFKTRRQKVQLLNEQTERELAQIELKAVRSQLNPHFIFNALSSIQGLVNKKDREGSNRYLSEFSSLMRSTLKGGDKEFTALSTEISTVESYLKLEQLRFDFCYTIVVDDTISITETEVPALMLQPLVENAVKHGVASLQEKGDVEILIKRQAKDLLIVISDNGKGFIAANDSEGHGLKLTKERLTLLNGILKEQSIQLNFLKGAQSGMQVTLQFNNWL